MLERIKEKFTKKTIDPSVQKVGELSGTRAAIIATDGFEQSELFEPLKALQEAGAAVDIVSLHPGKIKSWYNKNWGKTVQVTMTFAQANPSDYDFLMIPGGVINPDKLRMDQEAVSFVTSFFDRKRPVAAICHGPQLLIETNSLEGRTMTSWPSIKTDLINAGANWVDEEVVVDSRLITSRKPADLMSFNKAMISEFSKGRIHHAIPDVEGYAVTL